MATVISTISLSTPPKVSATLKVTSYIPDWVKSGVKTNEPEPLPESTKTAWAAGRSSALKISESKSTSVAWIHTLKVSPSDKLWAPIESNTGVWFPNSVTVIWTTSLSSPPKGSLDLKTTSYIPD